jgi:TetR/AcrR family transcriptional regulator, transcriptional repressor for nem operon
VAARKVEPARRVGSETSKTRLIVLDAAQEVMLEDGYAAVTYRSIAARANVTAPLVQYYFPTLDDLFVELLRRRSDQNFERLLRELEDRPDEPLRIIWEFSTNETSAKLMTELMALANHRKAIQATILEVTERIRRTQLAALQKRWVHYRDAFIGLSPEGLIIILQAIPKMLQMEDSMGVVKGHHNVVNHIEARLAALEPRRGRRRQGPAADDRRINSAMQTPP